MHDRLGVKLLSCLILQFSYLNEDKFSHGFSDMINLMHVCVELSPKPQKIFCCAVIFFVLKNLNSLINLLLLSWMFLILRITGMKTKDLSFPRTFFASPDGRCLVNLGGLQRCCNPLPLMESRTWFYVWFDLVGQYLVGFCKTPW